MRSLVAPAGATAPLRTLPNTHGLRRGPRRIAVEAGARFVLVVNPLVPFVNDFTKEVPTPFGRRPRRVSDMGLTKIGY